MRYITNENGFIEAVSFGCAIECNNKTCTEYTGSVPTGYETLAIWSETANINAYKIVNGNLTYDSEEDARLQSLWESQSHNQNTIGDTLPIGSIVEYDGNTVPDGYEEVSPIVESGSNANGNWIKYENGTMICYGSTQTTVNINTAWGVLYETASAVNLGNLPQEFIEKPEVFIMPWQGFFVERVYNPNSLTSWGSFYPVRPTVATNWQINVSKFAIGKWK